jgi:hypothetical protein
MNLGNKIIERLKQVLNSQKQIKLTGHDRHITFDEEIGALRVKTEIEDFDKFSVVMKRLELTNLNEKFDDKSPIEILMKRADRLVNRVTYLLENLAVIEVDTINSKVQIRSASPHRENGHLFYYEIILNSGGKVTFERFQQKVGEKQRLQIPFKLTEEVLERLITDLTFSFENA